MPKPNFFSSGSPFLQHPLLTDERTATEIDFVIDQTKPNSSAYLLDVGCGSGRHCIELTLRGYQAVGIDQSEAMVSAARERAATLSLLPEFIQIRGEDFSTDKKFDAVICLFTVIGQINEDISSPPKINEHPLLNNIAEVLVSNGIFILEIPQKIWVVNNLKEWERFGDGPSYTEVQRAFDGENSILEEIFTLMSPEESRQYFLRYHLYDDYEIHTLLENTGFEVIHTYGDFHNAELTKDSPNMLVVARLVG